MYKIIGADQKEYGPVSSEQLRQWIAEGRVNAQTKVQVGSEWKPVAEVPEFADALSRRSGPRLSSQPQAPAYVMAPAPVKTSGMAITSLVLGILGFFSCGLTALFGLVFGFIAMAHIKKSEGQLGGWGLALAGTIVSAASMLLLILFLPALVLPALAQAKDRAQAARCVLNVKDLYLGTQFYASQHNGHLPSGANWCDAIKSHVPTDSDYHCPRTELSQRCGYAFNEKLAGKDLERVPGETVLFFEADAGWNASGGRELMISSPRHRAHRRPVYIIGFADGSVEEVDASRLDTLRWDP